MRTAKHSCSACGKPSSRKWNCVSNWGFPVDICRPHWNRWEKGATYQKENSHYTRPDLLKYLHSSNESNDRKQFDLLDLLTDAFVKELAEKMAASVIQPPQSRISFPFSPLTLMQYPVGNYNVDPAADLQIFGFRGHVCDKCLMSETYYVAFPNAVILCILVH
jgi:hypothetical protein